MDHKNVPGTNETEAEKAKRSIEDARKYNQDEVVESPDKLVEESTKNPLDALPQRDVSPTGISDEQLQAQIRSEIARLVAFGETEQAQKLNSLLTDLMAGEQKKRNTVLSRQLAVACLVSGVSMTVLAAIMSWALVLPGVILIGFAGSQIDKETARILFKNLSKIFRGGKN